MGYLRIKEIECGYKGKNRRWKQFTNGINDDKMTYIMRTVNQKDKWSHQQASISMGQISGDTMGPESNNQGHKRE